MKWLVTGGNGMLAHDLKNELRQRGHDFEAPDRDLLDITDAEQIDQYLDQYSPSVIANCAAYTAVDDAEEDEAAAFALNATAPQLLARAAAQRKIPLVHVSTDYVFNGQSEEPYPAGAPLDPLGAYGRTKAAGEWAVRTETPNHYVVRTAWLYGAGGNCFPKTLAKVLQNHGAAKVVDDQHGQPTWSKDVARIIADLVDHDAPPGTYHATSSGAASWFTFTRAIAAAVGVPPSSVSPVTSADFPRPAPRPAWSLLSHDSLLEAGIKPIGNWEERWIEAAEIVLK